MSRCIPAARVLGLEVEQPLGDMIPGGAKLPNAGGNGWFGWLSPPSLGTGVAGIGVLAFLGVAAKSMWGAEGAAGAASSIGGAASPWLTTGVLVFAAFVAFVAAFMYWMQNARQENQAIAHGAAVLVTNA